MEPLEPLEPFLATYYARKYTAIFFAIKGSKGSKGSNPPLWNSISRPPATGENSMKSVLNVEIKNNKGEDTGVYSSFFLAKCINVVV